MGSGRMTGDIGIVTEIILLYLSDLLHIRFVTYCFLFVDIMSSYNQYKYIHVLHVR